MNKKTVRKVCARIIAFLLSWMFVFFVFVPLNKELTEEMLWAVSVVSFTVCMVVVLLAWCSKNWDGGE
jgi:hypothetical protein